eukprot:891723-Ditylum_brightwellii.AAC.1
MEGTAQEKVANVKNFELFNMVEEHAKYDIQFCLGKPSASFQGKKIKTDVLSMYARLNFANLALDLIQQDIAGLIVTKSMVKFVPASLKYNKSSKATLNIIITYCMSKTHT